MVSFAQLRRFDPEPLRELADCYGRLARQLPKRADALDQPISRLSWHWDGKAYESAVDRFRRLRTEIDGTESPLRSISSTLHGAADDLQRAKGMLLDALDAAAKIPATVSDDGETITYDGPELDKERRIAVGRRMTEILDDIDAALAAAKRADQAAADALANLVPGHDPTNPGKGVVPISEIPPPGSDPQRVNAWWDRLTPAERQYLIHHHPDRIGALDGVPVVARDQANRVRLAREHEAAVTRRKHLRDRKRELEAELARAGARPTGDLIAEAKAVNAELALLDHNIRGMEAIESRLYRSGAPPAYLIGFEPGVLEDRDGNGKPDDDGHAIVAIGNPDTADHVATYVPGTGSDLSGIAGNIDRADRMADDAALMARGEDTSVICWLGYDAPDDLPDAASDDYAQGAVADLNRFQDGLRATHDGQPSHNTVLGHSYGTTVIGHAASADLDGNGLPDGLHSDELVFLASPGVGVDHASDLGVGADHVWATRAEGDPIIAANIAGWLGLGHGPDPAGLGGNATNLFGGHEFSSDPGGHSDYWEDGNSAREGIAGIVTGRYDQVPVQVPATPSPSPLPSPGPPRSDQVPVQVPAPSPLPPPVPPR